MKVPYSDIRKHSVRVRNGNIHILQSELSVRLPPMTNMTMTMVGQLGLIHLHSLSRAIKKDEMYVSYLLLSSSDVPSNTYIHSVGY